MKLQKIGLRTLKTASAVALAILLSQLLNLRSPFFAGIAAITTMQSSVSESFSSGVDRMLGTILGGVIALLFSLVAPVNPLSIGLGIIIIIYVCNLFGWKQSVQLSAMVFLSIILNYQEGSRVDYAFYRTVDTLFGLVVGTLFNYFVLPFDLENKMVQSVKKMYIQVKEIVEAIIWREENFQLESLRKDLILIEEDYEVLKKEVKFNLYRSDTLHNLEKVFELLENIYGNLSIIYSLDKDSSIDRENQEALAVLFEHDLAELSKKGEENLIYNYHLRKIIENLESIDKILLLNTDDPN